MGGEIVTSVKRQVSLDTASIRFSARHVIALVRLALHHGLKSRARTFQNIMSGVLFYSNMIAILCCNASAT